MTAPESDDSAQWPVSGASWPTPQQDDQRATHPFATPEALRYQVGGQLGRGGMGVVHSALDVRLGRVVALKRAATAQTAAQLGREASLTAGLDHPGIVQVHDAGIGSDGAPFYTMRLAGQRTLADALTETASLTDRLRLLRRVLAAAEAVAYAHDRKVLHCDLKPGNILLGAFGETQVADWGLACVLDGSPRASSAGTPGYLPPEHTSTAPPNAQTDVYALGVTLAEVIAGRPLAAKLAADRGSIRQMLAGSTDVPADLAAIVLCATDTDRNRRYGDAKALAADLDAFLDGRRVAAHRYTAWQHARRLAQVWRAPLAVAAVAVVVLVVGQSIAFVRTLDERDRAVAAEATAKAALRRADRNLGQALLEAARSAAGAGNLPEAEVLAARALELRDDPAARGLLMQARVQTVQRAGPAVPLPECLRSIPSAAGDLLLCLRADSVAAYDLRRAGDAVLRWEVPGAAQDGAWTPAGAVVSLGPARVALLDARDGRARPQPAAAIGRGTWLVGGADAVAVRFAADGFALHDLGRDLVREVKTCGGAATVAVARAPQHGPAPGAIAAVCDSGLVEVLADGASPTTWESGFGAQRGASTAWWLPDGRGLVIGTHAGIVGVFNWPGGARRYGFQAGLGQVLRITGGVDRAVATGDQGGAVAWDLHSGAELGRLPRSGGRAAAVTADGEIRMFGAALTRWRLPAEVRALALPGGDREHGLASAAIAGDGQRVALARADGTLLVVRTADGAQLFRDHPAEHVLKVAAWSADGAQLAVAAAQSPGLVEYRTQGTWARLPASGLGALRRVIAMRSGARVVAPYAVGLQILPSPPGALPFAYTPTPTDGVAQTFRDLAAATDLRHGVAVDNGGGIHHILDGTPVAIVQIASLPGAEVADIVGGGALLAVASAGQVTLLDRSGKQLRTAITGGDRIHDIAFSPDGRWLAVGEMAGIGRILDVATLQTRAVLAGHTRRVSTVAFDPGGQWLLTASWDGSARIWDMPTLTLAPAVLVGEAAARWEN